MGLSLYDSCFTGETLVATEDGFKRIDEIQVGDKVWAYNIETKELELKEVVAVFVRETKELLHLTTSEGELTTTSNHPFYIEGKGWVAAGDLELGDEFYSLDGSRVTVLKWEYEELEETLTVYNMEVEDFHTYFVGEYGVLVHNEYDAAGGGPKGESQGVGGASNAQESSQAPVNTGRGKNNLKPDTNAQGAHSVYKRDSNTGKITNYKTYEPNPKNPSGFDDIIGYDGVGRPHVNKATGESLMPHVHDKTVPGGVRAPYPYEIPK